MKARLIRLAAAISGGLAALSLALALPVAFGQISVYVPTLAKYNPLLIAVTFAQTAPSTLPEITAAVTDNATSFLPGYQLYAVFGLLVVFGIFLIVRLISGLRRG